jgi:spore germination protein YaaH
MLIARPPAPSHGRPHQALGNPMTRVCLSLCLVLAAMAGGTPYASTAAAAAPSTGDGFGNAPTVQYQQAMQHAGDNTTFLPGDAVTVPYKPRRGDTAKIDGKAPVALPAGLASGRAMARSPEGSIRAAPDVTATSYRLDGSGADATLALAQTTPATTNVLRREVYGYLPYWESGAVSTLNYDVLSTVAYFGLDVDSAGNLVKSGSGWSGWTSQWMANMINDAHAHGTRVALSVESFAWTSGEAAVQAALLSSPAAQANLVAQIVGAVSDRGADGVSVDFEPIASGQKDNFVTFVRALRSALDAVHPGYEIVFDATGYMANYDAANLLAPGAADAVFIMGYDFRTGNAATAGSISPLTSPKVYDLTDAVNAYKAKAPVSSIILGLPYYGIAWSTTSNAPNATNQSGGIYPGATSVTYGSAAALAAANGHFYDSIEQSAWTAYQLGSGSSLTWRELYYDDAQSLAAKDDMINYWNLRGSGIWALGYDGTTNELVNVLASKFLTDNNPPKAGIVNLGPAQQNEGFAVSWTGRDDWNGVQSYGVQVSTDGSPFVDWLTGTTATSSNFAGATGHNYSFRVRATDGIGNVGSWDLSAIYNAAPAFALGGFATVKSTSLNERSSPTTSASTIRQASAGTILQIIGGPVAADGYTWYQVTGPFTELNAIAPLFPGLWVAVSNGSTNYVTPVTPPNSTSVTAGISGFSLGTPGVAPSGTGIDRGRVFSPDGDGIHDTMPLHWTNDVGFDDVTVSVFGANGTLAGSIDLGAHPSGPQSLDWNGKVDGGGASLADGQYILQVRGAVGSAVFYAPSPAPFTAAQSAAYGVIIDTTPTGTYYPVAPVRILDSRIGLGLSGSFVSGQPRSFAVAGAHGVPANAIAVTGNVTVTLPTVQGWVRLGSSTSGANSTINFKAGDNRANGVILGLAPGGSLSALYTSSTGTGTVHIIFDLTGYFVRDANGATFVPVTPARVVDTRLNHGIVGPLVANKAYGFQVTGLAGVPANATAVSGNATVVGMTGAGYVAVVPSFIPGSVPSTSTVNFPLSDIRANNLVVPLAAGQLQVEYVAKAGTSVQFIFDVTGYFVPGLSGATFVPVSPARLVDSRTGLGYVGPLATGSTAGVAVSGHASVDPVAVAVVGNLTVTGQTSGGWLAAAPGRATNTSTLNFPVGDNRANGFVSVFGSGGSLTITYGGGANGAKTHFVVDVMGYYR